MRLGSRRTRARRAWPWGSAARLRSWPTWAASGLRPAPLGAYPAGASAYGAEQMIGDVWEWTSSDFTPWPGFVPMIYRAYSEPFFGGDYKVLRGGSWAVAPVDHPALVPQLGPPGPAADLHGRATGLGRLSVPSPCLAWRAALAGELLLEPEHGLLVQSYAPRRQAHGPMNADGWGAGFFAAGRPEPARWRSNRPLWSDSSFASVAPVVASFVRAGGGPLGHGRDAAR